MQIRQRLLIDGYGSCRFAADRIPWSAPPPRAHVDGPIGSRRQSNTVGPWFADPIHTREPEHAAPYGIRPHHRVFWRTALNATPARTRSLNAPISRVFGTDFV